MALLIPLSASAYVEFPITIYGASAVNPTSLTWQVAVSPGDVVTVRYKPNDWFSSSRLVVNDVYGPVPTSTATRTDEWTIEEPYPTVTVRGGTGVSTRNWIIYGVWVNGVDINMLETVETPPDPPKLTGSIEGGQVHLSWSEERYAFYYNVYLNKNKIAENLEQTSFTYTPTENEVLSFTVTAGNHIGESAYSNAYVVFVDTIPPAAPKNVRVAEVGNGFVTLSWSRNEEGDMDGYFVYRDGVRITGLWKGIRYTDTGVTNGETYSYYVTAVDTNGNESQPSATVEATPHIAPPAVPVGLRVNPGNEQVQVMWQPNQEPDLAGYILYRDGSPVTESLITRTQYLDTGLENFVTYEYRIQAVNTSNLESGLSDPVYGMPEDPDITPPEPPLGLTGTPEDRMVLLEWDPNTEDDLAGYFVYRDGQQLNREPIQITSYTDTGLRNGQAYTYTVRAVDHVGNISDPSNPVTVIPELPASAPPQNVRAQSMNQMVRLTWSAKTGAMGYMIYRDGVMIATVTDTSYLDEGLTNGEVYEYQVSAIVDGVESDKSLPVYGRPGEILDFPNGENQGPPGLSSIIGTTWNFIGQFNPYLILILALFIVPVMIGFVIWLISARNEWKSEKRAKAIREEMDRIYREATPQQRAFIDKMGREERERAGVEIERHHRIRERDRETTWKALQGERGHQVREMREPRAPRYAGREERAARTGRPERGGRRGRE